DRIVTQGWPTTAASAMLAGYVSPFDATAVRQANQAGAITLGKVNCDEFGMGAADETSAHGALHLADPSSPAQHRAAGGAAAAVSSGLVMAALDTPADHDAYPGAASHGVTRLHGTRGLVSRYGLVANASTLDQICPVARHARD